jgi:hypothetical protein
MDFKNSAKIDSRGGLKGFIGPIRGFCICCESATHWHVGFLAAHVCIHPHVLSLDCFLKVVYSFFFFHNHATSLISAIVWGHHHIYVCVPGTSSKSVCASVYALSICRVRLTVLLMAMGRTRCDTSTGSK